MRRIFSYQITTPNTGITIERFLREKGYSRHIISHLKKYKDGITCDGVWAYTNQILQEGDLLVVNLCEELSSKNIIPVAMPLNIVYEDKDIMVLNKVADMPIHPSQNNHDNTLANGVAYYFATQGIPYTYRCINRLDRDTTGLLILAKHMLSAAILSQMMKERQIKRTYLALVEGCPAQNGTVNALIGRKNGSTIERIIDEQNGETAITHYKVLKSTHLSRAAISSSQTLSLVELHLETGRTHQIRVHMTSIGHPLVGDSLYNPSSRLLNRQALHSSQLSFNHPITKVPMHFTCPLTDDISSLISVQNKHIQT